MSEPISLSQLNNAGRDQFVGLLEDIFEHSSWIPLRAWEDRTFDSIDDLHAKMVAVVDASSAEEQLGLLRAHPQLAGKEARDGALTKLSSGEQQHVGMNALSSVEMAEVRELNDQYQQKFGFPFIIAVRDNTKADIFGKWKLRLANDVDTETRACLEQVYLIARLRLTSLIDEKAVL